MFYIPQIQKDDCGFTCLKIVLANLNKDRDYLFLPQKEDHGYYSYSDIMKIGREHGVNFEGFRATEKSELINCTKFPLILSIELKNGAKHAVVVTKIKWKRVFFIDPRKGKTSLSINKFLAIWDGTGLMIDSYEKQKCSIKAVEPVSLVSRVGLSVMEFVVGVFALLGIYFVKEGTPIYVPVIFLSLAIVTELIMRALAYKVMKGLDSFFFRSDVLPKKGFKDYLYRYENYKRLSLSSPMNYVLLLVFALGLVAVVLLNDKRNLMLIIVPVVIALFDLAFISPMLKNKKQEIADLESDLDNSENSEDLQSKVKTLHTAAYNYSYIDIACRYIYAGVMIAAALLTMRLCGISSFPYIIFYSCICLSLYKTVDQLLSFNDRIEEFNIVKVKLGNLINRDIENK